MTDPPSAPEPDTKDWTWVLEKPCSECGLDTSSFEREAIPAILRDNAQSWMAVLERANVRARPEPATWSQLEYACHVRDVNRKYLERLGRMLAEDGPHFENWDQDATAMAERYDLADPIAVAEDLMVAASKLAAAFDEVNGEQWGRTGFRSDGAEFTVESFARYFIHDPIHHLSDVS